MPSCEQGDKLLHRPVRPAKVGYTGKDKLCTSIKLSFYSTTDDDCATGFEIGLVAVHMGIWRMT